MRRTMLTCLTLLAATPLAADQVCVENASGTPGIFVAHADGGPREVMRLAPGGRLCSDGDGPMGTVAVFAEPTDIEGCSRRVPTGSVERLEDFPNVDLCRWSRAE